MNFIYSIINEISKVSLNEWVTFIGSALGFLAVIIPIIYTNKKSSKEEIKMSEEQIKYNKRISVKPYLDIKLNQIKKSTFSFGFYSINKLNGVNSTNAYECEDIGIEINNLGQGNFLDCKLVKIIIDDKIVNDEYGYIGNLKVDENALSEITFKIYYGDMLNEVKEEFIGKNIKDCPKEFEEFAYNHLLKEVELQFEYKDVLDNKYRKNIVIEIFIKFDILAEKYIWEISDIKFNDVNLKINGNLTTENLIK
ncbi:hypothetical protein [Paraclostridium bifermentans]|uniref:hypothetical protein n=1 Tax=Paraclostridium bifermentans TaxID=1490 RepID=UPI0022E65F7D|nr:hypothetical protein [Paraclostridium bifermentans]